MPEQCKTCLRDLYSVFSWNDSDVVILDDHVEIRLCDGVKRYLGAINKRSLHVDGAHGHRLTCFTTDDRVRALQDGGDIEYPLEHILIEIEFNFEGICADSLL